MVRAMRGLWLALALASIGCGRTALVVGDDELEPLVADAGVVTRADGGVRDAGTSTRDTGSCPSSETRLAVMATLTADNQRRVFFDGLLVEDTNAVWYQPSVLNLELHADPAVRHVLAIEATNLSSQGGFDRGLILELRTERATLVTDERWRVSPSIPAANSWREVGFDDSGWAHAVSQGPNGSGPWGQVMGISGNALWLWSYRSDVDSKPNVEGIALRRSFAVSPDGTILQEPCTR